MVFFVMLFLSHLCGGEPGYKGEGRREKFLSHLCGGEHFRA
ncbi:hypothetical protein BSPWISOX_1651 [uncultured Gammaproteobacteria bacterium]|nr:hypothetical protein BSPWISOX_1651 [uncultured Gammaproteobacteria bacterium]